MKKKRKNKSKGKWPKIKGQNRHHWLNKCNGGTWTVDNISYLHIDRHDWWHKIFKNLNLDEVIELLIRIRRIKSQQPHKPPAD